MVRASAHGALLLVPLLLAGCEDDQIIVLPGDGIFSPSTVSFGVRALRRTHEAPVTLKLPVGGDSLQIADVTFEPPTDVYAARLADGGLLTRTIVVPGKPLPLKVLFEPYEPGTYDGSMVVAFQNNSGVRLTLQAVGAEQSSEELSVSPNVVAFNNAELGRDFLRSVEIQNHSNRVLTVSDVYLAESGRLAREDVSPAFVTRAGARQPFAGQLIGPGGSVTADVHYKPLELGPYTQRLVFYSDGFAGAELTVNGAGVPAGAIRCAPRTLDFGAVVRGYLRDLTFTCSVDSGVVTVGAVVMAPSSSPLFSVASAPAAGLVLNAGDSFDVAVRFRADGLQVDHMGDVLIRSDLRDLDLVRVMGRVDPPPLQERALSVLASWYSSDDLDLHLVRGGAEPFDPINDCYYQRKNPDWGVANDSSDDPFLDRDDVDFGPEEINLTVARDGRYDIFAHFFHVRSATVSARVELDVRMFGVSVHRHLHDFAACGEMWHLGRIVYDGSGGRFELVDGTIDARPRAQCP